jgi:hypothetical protein
LHEPQPEMHRFIVSLSFFDHLVNFYCISPNEETAVQRFQAVITAEERVLGTPEVINCTDRPNLLPFFKHDGYLYSSLRGS